MLSQDTKNTHDKQFSLSEKKKSSFTRKLMALRSNRCSPTHGFLVGATCPPPPDSLHAGWAQSLLRGNKKICTKMALVRAAGPVDRRTVSLQAEAPVFGAWDESTVRSMSHFRFFQARNRNGGVPGITRNLIYYQIRIFHFFVFKP